MSKIINYFRSVFGGKKDVVCCVCNQLTPVYRVVNRSQYLTSNICRSCWSAIREKVIADIRKPSLIHQLENLMGGGEK